MVSSCFGIVPMAAVSLLLSVLLAATVRADAGNTPDAASAQHQHIGVKVVTATEGRTQHPDAQWFGHAGLGVFLHWGISSVDGNGDLSWYMIADTPWDKGAAKMKPDDYWALAQRFQPAHYDPDKWLKAAKKAGARYAVLTTRHHDGFALWPSAYGDFNTKNYLSGRDLVGEYVKACRANGLKVGLYYSVPDWYYNRDLMSFRWEDKPRPADYHDYGTHHQPITLPKRSPEEERKWNAGFHAYLKGQIDELLTRYGKIDVLWFDGSENPVPVTIEHIRQLQPGIVINPRLHGHADFETPEMGIPKQRPAGWWELCTQWSGGWGYMRGENYRSLASVLSEFVKVRAWGGNELINIPPNPQGELPEKAYKGLAEMAAWMKHSGASVTDTEAGVWPERCNVPCTCKGKTYYLFALPDTKDTLEMRQVPKPSRVTLLRTRQTLDFRYDNGTLHVDVPPSLRTDLVDAVAVTFKSD